MSLQKVFTTKRVVEAGCVNLEALNLHASLFTKDEMAAILTACATLKKLKILCVSNNALSDEMFKGIQRCSALEEIDVSQSPITDKTLASFSNLPSLTRLMVEGTRVTDEGLKNLTKLVELSVGTTKVSNKGLVPLKSLKRVSINNSEIDSFEGLEGVTHLDISFSLLKGLKGINPQIEELQLSGNEVGEDELKRLEECKSIRVLALKNCPIGDSSVETLSKLTGAASP